MSTALLSSSAALRAQLAGFEPAELSGADCAQVAEDLAATEKACAAARVLAAARAIACKAHEPLGFADGAAWLARQGGTTTGQARQALGTVAGLGHCPGTKAALVSGEVSWAEAAEVARAEAEAPGSEQSLLAAARSGGLGELRDKARDQVASATPAEDLHRRQRQGRYFRHWRHRLGLVCFAGALPPEAGVPLVNRLEALAQRQKREAVAKGAKAESFEAHAADALVALASGHGPRAGLRAEVTYLLDVAAARRGHAHPGEVCHILGGGPVPVGLVSQVAEDAFVKAVLHDGVAVQTVKHFGRHLPAELRTALGIGAPPDFKGAACADCGRRYGLEYDHVDPLANGGATTLANLEPRCWADHQAKTERDRQAGLLGPKPPIRPANARAKPDMAAT